MKTILKKKLCKVLCCVLIFSFSISQSVTYADDIMFDLVSLGITKNIKSEDDNAYITKGEFMQLSVNFIRQTETAEAYKSKTSYDDIENSPYSGAINYLYTQGLLTDFSNDSKFYPDEKITIEQACKILVKVIGYDVIMTEYTDAAYYTMAGKLGINKNVNISRGYITYKDAYNMLYNCLSVKALEFSYNLKDNSHTISDKTLREDIYYDKNDKIVKMKGIVTADSITYLNRQINSMRENQIEIDGVLFDCDAIPPSGLVGMEVEIYVASDGNNESIISMRTTEKNKVVEILGFDIDKFDRSEIKYTNTENYKKNVKLNQSTKYIYNNNLDLYFSPNELTYNSLLTVRAIDNNDDGIADVVFVFEYTDAVVKHVYKESKTLSIDKKYNGFVNVCLDTEKKDINVEIYTEDGSLADIEDIAEGDVVSLATSKDGYNIRVVSSKKTIKGYVRETNKDYIVIDNVKYRLANDISRITGKTIEAKLDFYCNIVDYEVCKENKNFAFVYDAALTSKGDVYIRALMPDNVASETIEGSFDESTNSVSSQTNLYVNNEGLKKYKLDEKVRIDGKKYNSESIVDMIKHQAISYEIQDDIITKINYLTPLYEYETDTISGKYKVNDNGEYVIKSQTVDQKLYYNSSERIFAGGSCLPFAIDDSTLAVCVPVNNVISDRSIAEISSDELLNFKMELTNSSTQYISAYEIDEDSHISEFIVINQNASAMHIAERGTIRANKKYVGLVTKSTKTINEDDEIVQEIKMFTIGNGKKASEQTFYVSENIPNPEDFEEIRKGDLISYSLDYFDRLDNFQVIKAYSEFEEDALTGEGSDRQSYTYNVCDIDFDEIDNSRRRWVDIVSLSSDSTPNVILKTFKIPQTSSLSPVVYIIDLENVYVGEVKDICVGDRVCVYYPKTLGDVAAIVVYR